MRAGLTKIVPEAALPTHGSCRGREDASFPRRPPSLFPPLKVLVIIMFTFEGCLLCTFLKKVVLAVKKQSSSSSSRLQYPLLMLLSTVIGSRPCLRAHWTAGLGLWKGPFGFCA